MKVLLKSGCCCWLTIWIKAALKLQGQVISVITANPRFVSALKEQPESEAISFICSDLHLSFAFFNTGRILHYSFYLTCCQDELTIPWHFEWGCHCGHLEVLNELNPALDVWGGKNIRQKRLNNYKRLEKTKQSALLKQWWWTHRHLSFEAASSSDLTATANDKTRVGLDRKQLWNKEMHFSLN